MWKVPLFDLNYDDAESQAVQEVLISRWLTMGEKTIAFEQQFGHMLNNPEVQCTFVSNCTVALYMALLSLGLKENDEVIIPSLTFVADINAVLMIGAKPVLSDCSSFEDWNISAERISRCITSRTRAVVVVHFAGFPCDMDPIVELCKRHQLFLIEDVAHAPGASYKGKMCGTIGDIGCFSFFSNKNLSMGEGGMLSTKNPEMHQIIRNIRSHGMTAPTLDRHKGRAVSYDVIRAGLNFRSDEIHAALGIAQLNKLRTSNNQRASLTSYYRKKIDSVDGVRMPFTDTPDTVSSYHILPVILNSDIDRMAVIYALKEAGIQTSIHYPSFHQFTAFKGLGLNNTPIADLVASCELTLPLYPTLSTDMVDYVVDELDKAIRQHAC